MKKTSLLIALCSLFFAPAHAGYDDDKFKAEVLEGLDIHVAKAGAYTTEEAAVGELGMEVYETKNSADRREMAMYIPTTMYIRGGASMNLGFASSPAKNGSDDIELSGSWGTQMGLGWNLSSYVRTEIDFQTNRFGFSDFDGVANSRAIGGNLYFDLARRWVRMGDITKRRTFVPFMGFGAGVGSYKFEGFGGESGAFIAPRFILGFNIAMTDLIGVDLTYQYQIFVGDGFGWNTNGGVGLSDLMLSFRVNF